MQDRGTRGVGRFVHALSLRRCGVAGALALAAVISLTAGAAAVPPPPPNPSDGQLNSSRADADARAGDVGRITNQLAQAEQDLDNLNGQVELKRENANKALVDMQTAQTAASRAKTAADTARAQADAASGAIDKARQDLDAFAEGSYEQGSTVGSMSAYIGAKNPQDFLERAQLLNAVSGSKLNALDTMQRARTEKANKDSIARAALADAQRKQAAAENAKHTADQAQADAISAARSQAQQNQQLSSRKTQLEQQLDAAQAKLGGLTDARKRYNSWLAAKQAAEEQAAAAAAGAPSGGVQDSDVPPAAVGSVQAVIDRAKSALGIRYSWGGGNASGPTFGVHDGGVADSYGDYMHSGFDCSGLMVYAFAAAGVSLPHYSGYQYTSGQHVPLSQIEPGDMVFYGNSGIHHVALYIGHGQMIEAPESGMVVRITTLRYGDILPYATRML